MENTGTLKSTSTVPPVVARLSHVEAKETSNSRKSLTRVAWLSILLGLLMEVLLASVQFGVVEQLAPFAAELANKLTWAFLVCMGLAIGKGLSKDRALWLGFAGLATAPGAFILARGVQKGAAEMLNVPGPVNNSLVPVMSGLRGIEYMCLGLLVFWLSKQKHQGAVAHILLGLGTGLAFGGVVLALTPALISDPVRLVTWGVNELVFPAGCVLVLYVSSSLGKKAPAHYRLG